ncbi:MAG: NAD(P)-dependent oxidoreductase [Acidobacteriota bacterium]
MITVLGASGFVGSSLVKKLKETDREHFAPGRDEALPQENLGNIIYCIGFTADFRSMPFETVSAHVCKLLDVVRDHEFDSLTYLSSARVYEGQLGVAREEDPFEVAPLNLSNLYNISKAMGESLSFACGKNVRVVRLSNVYGDDFTSQNFLSTIIKQAVSTKRVTVQTSPDSEKDYVSVHDVVDALIKIVTSGTRSIYNVASGVNVSHQRLLERISELTGCHVDFIPEAPRVSYPPISIERMRSEFGFRPSNLLEDLSKMVNSFRSRYEVST